MTKPDTISRKAACAPVSDLCARRSVAHGRRNHPGLGRPSAPGSPPSHALRHCPHSRQVVVVLSSTAEGTSPTPQLRPRKRYWFSLATQERSLHERHRLFRHVPELGIASSFGQISRTARILLVSALSMIGGASPNTRKTGLPLVALGSPNLPGPAPLFLQLALLGQLLDPGTVESRSGAAAFTANVASLARPEATSVAWIVHVPAGSFTASGIVVRAAGLAVMTFCA